MRVLKNKKGFTLGQLAAVGVTFVVIAIVLGMGAKVLDKVDDTMTSGTVAYSSVQNGTAGIGELASWLPTIAIIVAAAVIIGIVVTYFAVRQ